MIEHVSWRAVFFLNLPLAIIVAALSFRFMDESRDPSRTARIDWSGAGLAVLGLGAVVFGLLEWPPLGAGHPLVVASLLIGLALIGHTTGLVASQTIRSKFSLPAHVAPLDRFTEALERLGEAPHLGHGDNTRLIPDFQQCPKAFRCLAQIEMRDLSRAHGRSRQPLAATLFLTCSGVLAPAITQPTRGFDNSQPNASSSRERSRCAQNSRSFSTMWKFSSLRKRSE